MCEQNAYIIKQDKEQLIMESVELVEPEGADSWRIVDLFGDQKVLKGRLRKMNLVEHKILFEALDD